VEAYPDIRGRVAVVLGGSRGMGAALCRLLAAHGAAVACAAREAGPVEALAAELRAGGARALGVAADCTGWEAVESVRLAVERDLGPTDLLAAFVGGDGRPEPLAGMGVERWRAVVDRNLTSTFLALRSFLPGMMERGRGAAVTMASTAGRQAGGASAAYGAAQAGVVMLTRQAAAEAGPRGVRVNCVAPSSVLTERVRAEMPDETRRQMAAFFPLGRVGAPDDVARAVLFLLSDAAAWITGATLDITGGRVMA
jgi:3-oxoacyl-[acyl-carrier protein] reductase